MLRTLRRITQAPAPRRARTQEDAQRPPEEQPDISATSEQPGSATLLAESTSDETARGDHEGTDGGRHSIPWEDLRTIEVAISPQVSASVVLSGSAAYEAACLLRAESFERVRGGRRASFDESSHSTYVEATGSAPERQILIGVFSDTALHASAVAQETSGDTTAMQRERRLIATARLELPGATLIEEMIQLRPGSSLSNAFIAGTVAEIGGFATIEDLDKGSLLDALDAIVSVTVEVANRLGIEHLLVFPRNGFISLVCAEIPSVLTPYHLQRSPDVTGWREASGRLAQFRSLGLRGLGKIPVVYVIGKDDFGMDLAERLRLRPRRQADAFALAVDLQRAMLHAQRQMLREDSQQAIYSRDNGQPKMMDQAPVHPAAFLPLADAPTAAAYLRSVVERGGLQAQAYKQMSYDLLSIRSGDRILDVGCGAGVDLRPLAEQTGPGGAVIGVDSNREMIKVARDAIASSGLRNTWVFEGNAEHLAFADGEFDRVRTDRALQHMEHPDEAIIQMHRILQPSGTLVAIEPDWGAMVVSPGSVGSEDDDSAFLQIIAWCRRHLAHPLMGRQLYALLRRVGPQAWDNLRVDAVTFTFTAWQTLDLVLQLSRAAHALQSEGDNGTQAVHEWLQRVEDATAQGEFYAAVPLFFAVAQKSA